MHGYRDPVNRVQAIIYLPVLSTDIACVPVRMPSSAFHEKVNREGRVLVPIPAALRS
jgi:hypothetical protein